MSKALLMTVSDAKLTMVDSVAASALVESTKAAAVAKSNQMHQFRYLAEVANLVAFLKPQRRLSKQRRTRKWSKWSLRRLK